MPVPSSAPRDLLALDVGTVRIGVARASSVVRLAEPLRTINNDEDVWTKLLELCEVHNAEVLVVGLPRGLDGQETAQTASTRLFADKLAARLPVAVILQDEALTSHKAEQELTERGRAYDKGDVDALAATYILEDYLATHHGKL